MTTLTRSQEVYERLCEVIPGGVNSPVRACKNILDTPLVVEEAKGDMVYDVDGNGYIDYCGSWGALIHGHVHPQIIAAVQRRIMKGTTFGITTEIEEQLARRLIVNVPSIEKIRFVSSGTEATMSAARLARGYTERDLIIKFNGHYHGHADLFLINAGSGVFDLNATSSSKGIPDDSVKNTVALPFNDLDACQNFIRKYSERIAAVILEPIAGNMGVVPANPDFIEMLRNETEKNGIVLIFDEVMTGFRVGLRGAQGYYGISPDMTCFGKIVGGGFPVAAFGGKSEIMDHLAPEGGVYQAGTLSGNPVAMEAGLQAILILERDDFYEELKLKTQIITEPLKERIHSRNLNACVQEAGSMFTIFFGKKKVESMDDAKELDVDLFNQFFRKMFEQGIYLPPSQYEAWFVSMAHSNKHLKFTRDAILSFLESL